MFLYITQIIPFPSQKTFMLSNLYCCIIHARTLWVGFENCYCAGPKLKWYNSIIALSIYTQNRLSGYHPASFIAWNSFSPRHQSQFANIGTLTPIARCLLYICHTIPASYSTYLVLPREIFRDTYMYIRGVIQLYCTGASLGSAHVNIAVLAIFVGFECSLKRLWWVFRL